MRAAGDSSPINVQPSEEGKEVDSFRFYLTLVKT